MRSKADVKSAMSAAAVWVEEDVPPPRELKPALPAAARGKPARDGKKGGRKGRHRRTSST
jgi:hypothetical protein